MPCKAWHRGLPQELEQLTDTARTLHPARAFEKARAAWEALHLLSRTTLADCRNDANVERWFEMLLLCAIAWGKGGLGEAPGQDGQVLEV